MSCAYTVMLIGNLCFDLAWLVVNLIYHSFRFLYRLAQKYTYHFGKGRFDLALELWTDPEVVKYVGEVPTEAKIRHEMPAAIKRGGDGGIGIWCIADRKTGNKLADTYLLPLPIDEEDTDFSLVVMGQMPDAEIEIGCFLKPAAWGRGYATEVCKRLLQFAFQEVLLNEVVATINEDKVASGKVLEKAGLLDRGRTRCYGKDSPI